MNKIYLIVFVLLSSCVATKQNNEFIQIYNKSSKVSFYQNTNSSFTYYFLDKKASFNNKEYTVKIRTYSWGDVDTSYYRMDSTNFYHYKVSLNEESIVIPRKPILNQKWLESDNSWQYIVIKENQILTTPSKVYTDCVVLECKQLTNRDKSKSPVYYMYYSKGFGYVGNTDSNGKLLCYLKKISNN